MVLKFLDKHWKIVTAYLACLVIIGEGVTALFKAFFCDEAFPEIMGIEGVLMVSIGLGLFKAVQYLDKDEKEGEEWDS